MFSSSGFSKFCNCAKFSKKICKFSKFSKFS